jgi:hypothetical protein
VLLLTKTPKLTRFLDFSVIIFRVKSVSLRNVVESVCTEVKYKLVRFVGVRKLHRETSVNVNNDFSGGTFFQQNGNGSANFGDRSSLLLRALDQREERKRWGSSATYEEAIELRKLKKLIGWPRRHIPERQ